MGKKENSSSSSESFKSARSSSLNVVPSKIRGSASVTIKGNSDEPFHSLEKKSNKPTKTSITPGAKSNTIKGVIKEGTITKLTRVKSVGNIPNDVGAFVVKKPSTPVVIPVEVKKSLIKCSHIPIRESIGVSAKFQSDHNPVIVYLPGLFDGTKSAYVITYNEKGNSGYYPSKESILSKLPFIKTVDMVFIGIQEGDVNKLFVNDLINNINTVFAAEHTILYKPHHDISKYDVAYASPNNMILTHKDYKKSVTPSNQWVLTTNTYGSTGKECLKKWKGVCLVNGCYVLIKNGSGLEVIDSGKDIIMKGHVLNTTKHCAWSVIKQNVSGVKHVFASCHLEYSGKYNPETGDLLGYYKRKEQLTGYITMLYKKYGDAGRFIFCGDTNMRMLTSAMYEHDSKKNYILDQMLYYLMQCDTELKSIKAIRAYTGLGDVSKYEFKDGRHVVDLENSAFWDCKGCDIVLGRKMLLYRLAGSKSFCSYLTGRVNSKEKSKCVDQTESLLGKDILAKFNLVTEYVARHKSHDKFAGYCMNPEFIVEGSKFRAYDFSYKDLNDNCNMNTIWDVYNYGPTAIFTLDGPMRTFDYAKRVKSGNILAPAVVDRVFMFEPHKPYVAVDNTKIGFVTY
jgi:hypothetical protein